MPEVLNTWLFHWEPARAIWIGGHTLSWDARCSGIYIGFAGGLAYHAALRIRTRKLPSTAFLLFSSLLFLPLFLDVFSVSYGLRAPSNDVKYLTGLMFGETFSLFLFTALMTLLRKEGPVRGMRASTGYFAASMAVIAAAFLFKDWDSTVAYAALEALSVAGFLSLATILAAGAFLALRDVADRKPS